jgi:hypothetical protein
VQGFESFEVEVIFLWITANDPSLEDKDEAYRSHGSRKVLKNPAFCSFEDVNKTVGDRYAKALKEKKNMILLYYVGFFGSFSFPSFSSRTCLTKVPD